MNASQARQPTKERYEQICRARAKLRMPRQSQPGYPRWKASTTGGLQ